MAKTKRRQLAALAAQAELKEIVGNNDSTSLGTKLGQSGTFPQAGDPNVEIRTQRVIIKIPALPQKPPAADIQPPNIAKKQVLGKRRRKKPQLEMEPSSQQVPADEAKISKGIVQFAKWKRHKKIRDLLPTGVNEVPPSAGLSNGGQLLSVAKSMENDKHQNGELHLSVIGPQRPSKKRVKFMAGSRTRTKQEEVEVRSPPAEKESKLTENQGAKLQEVVVRAPTEKVGKLVKTQGEPKETKDSMLDRAASALVASKRRSRNLLVKDRDRSQALPVVGDGDLPGTSAHLPAPQKIRRGNIKKVIPQVPVVSPKATVVSHHRTRSRAKISYCEAMALEVLQEIRNVKNISQRMENLGKIAEKDTLLVRTAANGGANYTTRDQSQTEPQNSENFTGPLGQEKEQLAHVGLTADSSSHDLVPSGPHTSYHTCLQGDPPGGLKSQLHMPFAPGEQGPFLVGPRQGKDLDKSTAEIIKRDSQLTIMQKRLEAAGGLRKWLLDRGLGQFLPILEKWNLDNLSLMQLTMESLKNMGLLPVGPRRKLIHAISCLTLPSFTKPSPVSASGT